MTNISLYQSIMHPHEVKLHHHQRRGSLNTPEMGRHDILLLAPKSFIVCALDTILGLGGGIAAICTLGRNQATCDFTIAHLSYSTIVLSKPYEFILKAINPKANDYNTSFLGKLVKPLLDKGDEFAKADNFLKREVASRLTFGLAGIVAVIRRIVGAIIAIPVTCLSLLAAGRVECLNKTAIETLTSTGIIWDVFFYTLKILNPQMKSSL